MTPDQVFGPAGLLAARPGYVHRPQQLALAAFVADVFRNGGHAMAQAPTGVGKTLAYLVPAVLHARATGRPVIVSTATLALQDQILARDVPLARALVGYFEATGVKGRSHYLCPVVTGTYPAAEITRLLQGDRSDRDRLSALACTGRCVASCPLAIARAAARASQIVVTNHSLVLHDRSRKVLPDTGTIVLDEAQHLEHIITGALTRTIDPDLIRSLDRVRGADRPRADDLRRVLGETLDGLARALERPGRSTELRTMELAELEEAAATVEWAGPLLGILGQRTPLHRLRAGIWSLFHGDNWARWYDPGRAPDRPPGFHCAPIAIAATAHEAVWAKFPTAVLVGATLQTLHRFDRGTIGLPDGPELVLDPIFDYPKQALLALPRVPPPDDPAHPAAVAGVVHALATIFGGSTLALFTSYQALEATRAELARNPGPWDVVWQNPGHPTEALVQRFRKGGAVLLGTSSFWEGVDFAGDQLRALVIARLPFAQPDDPVAKARSHRLARPFDQYTIPQTSRRLVQGFGRLIRTEKDRGVCVIADHRIRTEAYGPVLLGALPACSSWTGEPENLGKVVQSWLADP